MCHNAVTIARRLVGTVVACPHCQKHFSIPQEGSPGIPVTVDRSIASTPLAIKRFTFICQRCNSVLEGRSDLCSQPGKCPTCGALFVVPEVDSETGEAVGPAIVADDGQFPTPMHAYATAGEKAPTIRRLKTGDQVLVCPRCRAEMAIDADICSACGIPFTMDGAASVGHHAPETNGLAGVALTIGILALLTAVWQPVIGLAAAGLGYAGMSKADKLPGHRPGRGLSMAGLVLGVLAIIVFVAIRLKGL